MKLHSLLSGFAVALCAAAPLTAQTLTPWDSPVKVLASTGSLTKSAGCEGCPDAGAHSTVQLTRDGYVEFVPSAGHRIIAGLGRDLSASTDASTIDYAFSLWPGNTWEVRERGVYRADGTAAAVGPYAAVVDRQAYAKPALPVLPSAGAQAIDPVFKSTITRITDSTTRPGYLNQSYRTPSATHQNTWSARLSYFYVMSGDGS